MLFSALRKPGLSTTCQTQHSDYSSSGQTVTTGQGKHGEEDCVYVNGSERLVYKLWTGKKLLLHHKFYCYGDRTYDSERSAAAGVHCGVCHHCLHPTGC